jgi:multidrug efflux pump
MATAKTEIFEKAPIKRAVLSQIIPAIASQMIALLYNLADTYFVGMLNDPVQTAAVTVASPSFVMLTALSNLFGVGGASAIARALGKKDPEKARQISALSIWGGVGISVLFSILFACFASPILTLCGAKPDTLDAARRYARWVVTFGGPFTVLNTLLANLVRSEGGAVHASLGVSMGGLLNILLDPFFVLPQFLGLGAAGAGLATAISNGAATLYFLIYLFRKRGDTVLSLDPKLLRYAKYHLPTVLAIGFPSAIQYALTVVAVAAQARFVANHQITEAVAALGIIKKLDQLPLYFSIGVANGLLPLLAYTHSAGNVRRRRQAFRFGTSISLGFALFCLVLYEAFAPQLVGLFMENETTVAYGADFLRIMVTAMPMMSVCYPMIIQFQAMMRARESLICSILRKGVLDIPLLFLMDSLLPLYGCMWVQPIVDTTSLVVAGILYARIQREERRAELPQGGA